MFQATSKQNLSDLEMLTEDRESVLSLLLSLGEGTPLLSKALQSSPAKDQAELNLGEGEDFNSSGRVFMEG